MQATRSSQYSRFKWRDARRMLLTGAVSLLAGCATTGDPVYVPAQR